MGWGTWTKWTGMEGLLTVTSRSVTSCIRTKLRRLQSHVRVLTLTWITIFRCNRNTTFFEKEWMVTFQFVVYVERLTIIDLATYVTEKVTKVLFFGHTYRKNSRVKRVWAGVVKWWVKYWKLLHDIVWVQPKYVKSHFLIAWSVKKCL